MTAERTTASFRRMTLARANQLFVLAALLIVLLTTSLVFMNRKEQLIDDALDMAVRSRTSAAGQIIARTLHGDWNDLRFLAQEMTDKSRFEIRNMIAGLRGDGSRISWVGFTDTAGVVLEASDGLLVGQDVSQRPWFRNGLNAGYAGDVHDAVLLSQKLRPNGGEPLRFIDLALPVRNAGGDVIGVVGMHIDAQWLADILSETGTMLGIDLFLFNQSGEPVVGPRNTLPGATEVALLRAASTGTEGAAREVWPDGRSYFTTLVPNVGYGDLPSFGWRMAGRISADSYAPGLKMLRTTSLIAGGVGLVIIALLTMGFARLILNPITRLSDAAERIASGSGEYPPEATSTQEASQLSAALVRLQKGSVTRRSAGGQTGGQGR